MIENKGVLPANQESNETTAASFLLLLLVADLAFLLIQVLLQNGVLKNPLYALARDGGYPEHFQYIKEIWIATLLVCIGVNTRVWGYLVWAALFAYLLCDDVLKFHERGGDYFAALMPFLPLRFGEALVSAVVAGLIFPLLAWAYYRGAAGFKETTRHIVLFLFALAFFSVCVDNLHILFRSARSADVFFKMLEECGEMLVMSFIAWYIFLRNLRGGEALGMPLHRVLCAALSRLLPKFGA